MDEKQTLRWHEGLLQLSSLESSSDKEDPWLFHGTSQRNARIIADNGFDPRTSHIFVPDFERGNGQGKVQECVFWTSSKAMALKFAEKQSHGGYDGFPVIFAARASDVSEAGALLPDYHTWDYDWDCNPDYRPSDWRDSLKKLSAVAVADCRMVANLRVFAPDDLDIWPDPQVANARFAENIEDQFNKNDGPAPQTTPIDSDEMLSLMKSCL